MTKVRAVLSAALIRGIEGTADPSTALVCETEESDALPKTDLFENQLLVHAPRTDFDCDGSPVRLYP
jgi:hypothetical protein